MHIAITQVEQKFQKTLEFLEHELASLQIGRATSGLVENIDVQVYGSKQPLRNIAQIAIPEPRSIAITPFDKNTLENLEKAIRDSSIGIEPVNDGHCIRVNIPPLTEERRKQVVKVVHEKAEEARVALRQERHTAIEEIRKDDLSEDEQHTAEKQLQEKVDSYNTKIDEHMKKKEKEVMTV